MHRVYRSSPCIFIQMISSKVLDYDAYVKQCDVLCERRTGLYRIDSHRHVGGTHYRMVALSHHNNSDAVYDEYDDDISTASLPPPPSSSPIDVQHSPVSFELDVIWSLSHSVPVLYFTASHADGASLSLQELWSYLGISSSSPSSNWMTVTQTIHPFNGRVYFFFHPCETNNMMMQLLGIDDGDHAVDVIDNYMMLFLSLYCTLLRIKMPLYSPT